MKKPNKISSNKSLHSVLDRFNSFSNWPRTFPSKFIMDLVMHGFYSTAKKKSDMNTKCIYCGFTKNNWKINDSVDAYHSDCFINNLSNKSVRIKYNKFHGFNCNKCKGIVLELKEGFKVILCGNCGGLDMNISETDEFEKDINNLLQMFTHRCCNKCINTRKLKFTADLSDGEYNHKILDYIEKDFKLNLEKIELYKNILTCTEGCVLDPVANAVEIKLAEIGKEVEVEMIKIDENLAVKEVKNETNADNSNVYDTDSIF